MHAYMHVYIHHKWENKRKIIIYNDIKTHKTIHNPIIIHDHITFSDTHCIRHTQPSTKQSYIFIIAIMFFHNRTSLSKHCICSSPIRILYRLMGVICMSIKLIDLYNVAIYLNIICLCIRWLQLANLHMILLMKICMTIDQNTGGMEMWGGWDGTKCH